MTIRAGVVGSAGTGKSGLAESLATRLGIAYVASKSITRPMLELKGYDWSGGQYVEEFLAQEECQEELLKRSLAAEEIYQNFITDRTPVDLAAYAIVLLYKKIDKVDEIVGICREHAKRYTHLIFCPWGQQPLEKNGVRTLNPWFQFSIHGTMMALLREWGLGCLIVSGSADDRIKQALEYIAPKHHA